MKNKLTLIPILLIVIITAAYLLLKNKTNEITESKDAQLVLTRSNMIKIKGSFITYGLQFGNYPSAKEGLSVLIKSKILNHIPRDGWNSEVLYRNPPLNKNCKSYELVSLGADKKPGGKKYNADIVLCGDAD